MNDYMDMDMNAYPGMYPMDVNANQGMEPMAQNMKNQMKPLTQQEGMLMTVQAYEFALVEVGLFLDTHPTDQTALAYFRYYRDLKNQTESEYTRIYGPIRTDHPDNDLSTWKWIESPWPWEIER